jgi:hypothetical protein
VLSGEVRQPNCQLAKGHFRALRRLAFPAVVPAAKAALLVGVYDPGGAVSDPFRFNRQKGNSRCFRAATLLRRDNDRFHERSLCCEDGLMFSAK